MDPDTTSWQHRFSGKASAFNFVSWPFCFFSFHLLSTWMSGNGSKERSRHGIAIAELEASFQWIVRERERERFGRYWTENRARVYAQNVVRVSRRNRFRFVVLPFFVHTQPGRRYPIFAFLSSFFFFFSCPFGQYWAAHTYTHADNCGQNAPTLCRLHTSAVHSHGPSYLFTD